MAHRTLKDQRELYEKLQKDNQFRKKMEQRKQKRPDMQKNKQLYYAGVGSRKTPEYILALMTQLASRLRADDMILRTGHASGADQAFERGAGNHAQIFLPWRAFEQDVPFEAVRMIDGSVMYPAIYNHPTDLAMKIASEIHPIWDNLTAAAQMLHARNAHQILGPDLARPTPVEFVICWTPGARVTGGTATAIRLALEHEIPVHNLADEDTYDMAFEWAWETDAEIEEGHEAEIVEGW
jgi:hypothetical protein